MNFNNLYKYSPNLSEKESQQFYQTVAQIYTVV